MQALRRERVFLMAQLQQARSAAPETASLRQLEEEYRRKSTQYDESHPDMISLRRQMDQLRSGGSTAGMTLQQQLQMQRSILSEARQRYSEDHPDIKRINRTIQSLEARIASGENAQRTLSSDSPMAMQLQTQLNATDSQLAALQARSMELRTKLNDLEGRLSAAPEVEREYQSVTRDLASARAKYEELLKRQMDAEVSEAAIAGGTADKFRVASMPGTPREPAKPQRIAIFVVSLVLGIAFGLTAVILAQRGARRDAASRDSGDRNRRHSASAQAATAHVRSENGRRHRNCLLRHGTVPILIRHEDTQHEHHRRSSPQDGRTVSPSRLVRTSTCTRTRASCAVDSSRHVSGAHLSAVRVG
jgi:uncharacterized protein involved in exopolysaccharide biosynthesis